MTYFNKKTIKDISVAGKKVLLRCDFDVPTSEGYEFISTRKIDESLETIKYLLGHNAKVIMCSHLGKPSDAVNKNLSLRPIAGILTKKLGAKVKFADGIIGPNTKKSCDSLKEGEAILLENLNFKVEEQNNDENFAKELASLADIFVNDDYAGLHKKCASTYGVTKFLPAVGGFLIQRKIETVLSNLEKPNKPFVLILGGMKLADKLDVTSRLLDKIDTLIIGGGIAYTFMNALGYSIGTSICEHDKADMVKKLMVAAKEKGVKLVMPIDNIVGLTYNPDTEFKLVSADSVPEGWMGLDIGPETGKLFTDTIKCAGTVFWSGSMGVFEWNNFASGTVAVTRAIAENSKVSSSGRISIICGDSSTAIVEKLRYSNKVTHILADSETTFKLLKGEVLPGVECLLDK